MPLSEIDVRLIRELRNSSVLQDVADDRLQQANGVILVVCGDGDEIPELLEFVKLRLNSQGLPARTHLIALNGGALRIPRNSPVNSWNEGEMVLQEIRDAMVLKGIRTVNIYAHAPCGKARVAGFSIIRVVEVLLDAGERIRREIRDCNVASFLHIDRGDRRTYYVSEKAWCAWHQNPVLTVPVT
ncbi:MAG: hypothetical protein A2842_01445 [Candidatus Wildermuthbacteria bacterium RIFCSPHIGHO2_01_FULL_48_25]|uniref:Uncharacterized protein n=1 Tax=Candidatus Wildermuthbacteria bacterium RIFCSPLOWO2_01_FULL_48_16 TaxID=1802461 RepID=A0A1G2RKI2_9BACT|nr:MAG: hypothetical protein A2842_01445 [Candidatus Wildermuthbacteria bacterium RIFCSPHIGHO2_01_FULL_48_25]OHA69105.1 MAG: hypothetical protein A3J57_00505 [Candidatus Wildermuthbacteria bacterium RIFCSPHIGHO2_02_FULL_49_12b]OHA72812.1 MAG: hypothetical protein A3B24_02795 [Candidatus Wildermuthbacteria bacterium RIFCSPLOWO2_01_FULL_48_16]